MATSKTIAIIATTLASVFARFASLASQAIVGWYLTEEQVGTFAVALGITGLTGLFRTGGVAQVLPGFARPDFDRWASASLAWALGTCLIAASATAIVAASAPRLANAFENFGLPGLSWVLVVLAVRQGLVPFSVVARARLSTERRFATIARVDALNALVRVGLTWVIAAHGGGTLSLVIPALMQTAVDSAVLGVLGGLRRTDLSTSRSDLSSLKTLMFWPLLVAILTSVRADVIYLVLGVTIPASALGIFYFGFQLANQPTMLLAASLQNVLAPYQAEDRGNREAERLGMERVFSGSMLFVPVTTIATASLVPSTVGAVRRWTTAGDQAARFVASLDRLPRDRPVVLLVVPDEVGGAYVARNAVTAELAERRGWRSPQLVWAATAARADGPVRVSTRALGASAWRVELAGDGAGFTELSSRDPGPDTGAVLVRRAGRSVVEVGVGPSGDGVVPEVWTLAGGRVVPAPAAPG